MALLRLFLLGSLLLQAEEKPLPLPATRKAQSLLAYLAMRRGRPQLRDHLAGILWPEAPSARARRSLNTALWQIRRVLPDGEHLIAGANDVEFSGRSACWLDATEFEALCHPLVPPGGDDAESTSRLRRAVSLYRGEFLAGLHDEWVLAERYRLEMLFLDALARLARISLRQGAQGEALHCAERLLNHDPLREDVHRLVIELHLALGDRVAAARQCNRCRALLRSELGIEPAPETMALCRPIFHLEAAPGDDPAREAGSPTRARRPGLDAPPLVGRDDELEQLLAAWRAAGSGRGQAILVSGEAGVGKTRLVAELAQSAGWRDGVALWGCCYEHQRSLPLQPLAEALQAGLPYLPRLQPGALLPWMLAEVAWLLPDLGRYHPGLPPPALLAPAHAQDRLSIALTSFLAAASAQVPLLLVLEDLHWAGEAVLAYVHYLARHLGGMRLLLVGTYRSDEAVAVRELAGLARALRSEGLLAEVPLRALPFAAVARLVSDFSPLGERSQALAEWLYRTTAGNPFYLVEMLHALGDAVGPATESREQPLPVPRSVRDLILGRAGRLSPRARELLDLSAVAGREFDLALLLRAWERGEEALLQALDDLLRHRFLREQAAPRDYGFDHDLTREVIYQDLHHHRRRRLHRRVGRALEALGERPVAELAYHLHRAHSRGDDPGPAAGYGLEAADQALRHHARREALAGYRRSRALLDGAGLTPAQAPALAATYARLCLGEGQALLFLGERSTAVSALQVGLAWAGAAGDAPAHAGLQLALGRAAHEAGDFAAATSHFGLVAAQSRAMGDRARLAEALHQLARTAYDAGEDPLGTAVQSEQALALSQEVGDLNLQGLAHWALGRIHYRRAQLAAADDHYRHALDCFRQVGNREDEGWTHLLWGLVDGLRYALDRAAAQFEAAEAIFRDLERPWGIGASLTQRGSVHLRRGELDRGMELLQEALALFRAAGNRWEQAAVLWRLGLASYRAGALDQARAHLAGGLALAEAIGHRELCLLTQLTMGDVHTTAGAWPAAEAAYERALALGRATDDRRFLPRIFAGLAGAALARGEPGQAAGWVVEGRSLAAVEDVEALGLLLRLAGEVAAAQSRRAEALALLRRSVELLAGPPVPFELARSRRALARVEGG